MSITSAIVIFIASCFALVKGADYLIKGAERVGYFFKLPSFVIGALIVGVGTSLPELATSISAVLDGASEIVVSNAVGSNIANILLVSGLAAVVVKGIVSTKNLTDLEIPMLVSASVLFLGTAYDGTISQVESVVLFAGAIIYICYLLIHPDNSDVDGKEDKTVVKHITFTDILMLLGGGVLLATGANYLISSVVTIAEIMGVSAGVIAISAVAVGTSLPEILVSITAVFKGKTDIAFGNVFGSNVFNIMFMVGSVGMFAGLPVDPQTYTVGLPIFGAVTLMFLVSVTSKKISLWEGLFFLLAYVFFLVKIFGIA